MYLPYLTVDLIIWLNYTYNVFLVLQLNLCRIKLCPWLKPWWELASICWYLRFWFFVFLLFHSPITFHRGECWHASILREPFYCGAQHDYPRDAKLNTHNTASLWVARKTYFVPLKLEHQSVSCHLLHHNNQTCIYGIFFMVIQTTLSLMDQIHILHTNLGLDPEDKR